MAVTAIWPVRGQIRQLIEYAENPDKTLNPNADYNRQDITQMRDMLDYAMETYVDKNGDDDLARVMEYAVNTYKTDKQYFVSGINCNTACARQQMQHTKERWQKNGGIVAYHAYQSFEPGEVTPDIAHEIGVKLAQELWGDRFEVIVCTHVNTSVVHNHFVLNSVSMADGKRYYDNKKSYARIRSASDRLCREYGLSVVRESKGRSKSYAEWQAEQSGTPTLRSIIRQDVDRAIKGSMTWNGFLRNLEKQGYTIKSGVKHIAICPPGKDRFVRLRSLGDAYEPEAIQQRILYQQRPTRRQPSAATVRRAKYQGVFDFKLYKVTWKSVRALYYHYLRMLKDAQAQSPEQEPAPFVIREDLRHYPALRKEMKFLNTNKIDSLAQIEVYRVKAQAELDTLTVERKELHDEKRRIASIPQHVSTLSQRTDAITKRIQELRGELGLCSDISGRATQLRKRLVEVREQQIERRVEDEPYRRRSRSGSPDGSNLDYRSR